MGHASTLHPTIQAKVHVGPETIRVMFYSGTGSSYLCIDVIIELNLRPIRKEQHCIEQMFGTTRRNVEVYKVTIKSLAMEGFAFEVESINAEKDVLRSANLLTKLERCHLEETVWPFEKTYSRSCGLSEDTHRRATDIRSESRQGSRC